MSLSSCAARSAGLSWDAYCVFIPMPLMTSGSPLTTYWYWKFEPTISTCDGPAGSVVCDSENQRSNGFTVATVVPVGASGAGGGAATGTGTGTAIIDGCGVSAGPASAASCVSAPAQTELPSTIN